MNAIPPDIRVSSETITPHQTFISNQGDSMKQLFSRRLWTIAALGMVVLLSGCSALKDSGSFFSGSEEPPVTPRYYAGFGDILIPGELEQNLRKTYVMQSSGISAGILAFKGRVDRPALISFFQENMSKDNWQLLGSLTSTRSILLFQKQNRWCVINITEGDFSTDVEIGIVPTATGP